MRYFFPTERTRSLLRIARTVAESFRIFYRDFPFRTAFTGFLFLSRKEYTLLRNNYVLFLLCFLFTFIYDRVMYIYANDEGI